MPTPFFRLAALILGLVAMGVASQPLPWEPKADSAAVVSSRQARFTVLSPRMIRMEWSEDGIFEDQASLVVVNRRLPVPSFQQVEEDGWLTITTEALKIRYQVGSGRFQAANLQVVANLSEGRYDWNPGVTPKGNLKGTTRTLDETNGATALEDGLLSRDGWTLLDDTTRPRFDRSPWPWVQPRATGPRQDLYLWFYGSDYKQALRDYTAIAGQVPLPPKYVFGAWQSRWWKYTDQELMDLKRQYDQHDLPLDVLVIDMDWHLVNRPEWYEGKTKKNDPSGENIGWTGFTWNRTYFPDPEAYLAWARSQGLKTCLNLHPASGIQPHEEVYPAFAKAMGKDPAQGKHIPFNIVNKPWATTFFDLVLHPMEKAGVNFWWLDWQQWSTTDIADVNPTWYLNYVFFTDMERQGGKRPLIYHRYGGLGNHRYPVGFSGDTLNTWATLDFQPTFTATASNVCFGYWSHDIGGFYGGADDPELLTRWVQLGAFSPILKIHYSGDPKMDRRFWNLPAEYSEVLHQFYHWRYALIPYIYSAARLTTDTGVSLCRPLYYDHPKEANAYAYRNEYGFGPDLLVHPITQPREKGCLFSRQSTWLPPGNGWVEWQTGTLLEANQVRETTHTLAELPLFAKAGAIIPMQPKRMRVDEKPLDTLILTAFPGSQGETVVYDDEGDTQAYLRGVSSRTRVTTRSEGPRKILTIHPVEGSFPGMPTSRVYELRLPVSWPPTSVRVNGVLLSRSEQGPGWSYDGQGVETVIRTASLPVNHPLNIEVEAPTEDLPLLSGTRGRLARLGTVLDSLRQNGWPDWKFPLERFVQAAQTGRRVTLRPETSKAEFTQLALELPAFLKALETEAATQTSLRPAAQLMGTLQR